MTEQPANGETFITSAEQLNLALGLHQRGQLSQAQAIYEKLLQMEPGHAEALHLLGMIAYQQRQFGNAVGLIGRAIASSPGNAAYHANRGLALQQLKQLEAAIADYNTAIAIRPDLAEAYNNRGNAEQELKKFDAAIADYDKAIAIRPHYAEAYFNRGNALRELKKLDAAIACYDKATSVRPDYAEAHYNRGNALRDLKKLDTAVAAYDKALAIKPDYAEAYNNRGSARHELKQPEAAMADYDKAIAIKPDYAEAYYNRGNALHDLRKLGAAIAEFDKAIALKPDYASAYWNKALALLLAGNLQTGFELYEWRWKNPNANISPRPFVQPLWLGEEPLRDKRILLHSEQGLGDTIQFCRYAVLLARAGAEVVLEAPRQLVALLQSLEGVSRIVAQEERLPDFDYHCPLLSLPLAFKTVLDTIPDPTPYLHADPAKARDWQERMGYGPGGEGKKLKIGVVWSGGFRANAPQVWTAANEARNIRLDIFARALSAIDADFFSLQKGDPAESEIRDRELEYWPRGNFHNFAGDIKDFSDTAALVANLDLVLTVDTATAHLAAALGKPTWILNRFDTDWRWLLDRDDSPWYRSVKLYRQDESQSWEPVLRRVAADLPQLPNQPSEDRAGGEKIHPVKEQPSKDVSINVAEQLGLAVGLHQRGQLSQAQAIYEALLRIDPGHADALHLLGLIAYQQRRFGSAVALIGRAIAASPGNAAFYANRGLALQELKQLEAAIADYDRAVSIKPDYAEAYSNRGNARQEQRQLDAAIADFGKAIAIRPHYAEAYYNRGNALRELGKLEAAIADYTRAIAIKPDYASAHNNRGNALQELKRLDAAIADFDKAIAIRPDYAVAYSNRGNAHKELKQLDAAIADYARAIAIKPDGVEAYYNRGNALREQGKLDAAIADYDKAIAVKPDYAEAYLNKALTLLRAGDFESGFKLYEWRWKNPHYNMKPRRFAQRLWLGEEPLRGKILLHSEQGLGDTIQFCRYASLLAKAGAQVILEVPAPLLGLLTSLENVDRIVAEGEPLPDFDYHCPLLSLPLALKTRLGTIPDPTPYLHADKAKARDWQERIGERSKLAVGVVWSGGFRANAPEGWDAVNERRNIRLDVFARTLSEIDADFFSLQKGDPAESEIRGREAEYWPGGNFHNYAGDIKNFSDTAALIANLDLVLSVDTSTAHLAAALGKPTWILNRFDPDWRWLSDRDDSPWYRSVKLYRQDESQDWAPVLRRVAADLTRLAHELQAGH